VFALPLDLTHTIQPDKFKAQRFNEESKLINLPTYEKFHSALNKLKDAYECSIKHRYVSTSKPHYLEYEEGNPNFSLFKLSPNGWFISDFSRGNQLWLKEPIDKDLSTRLEMLPNSKYQCGEVTPDLPDDFTLFPSQGDLNELPLILQMARKAKELKRSFVVKEHPFQGPELTIQKIKRSIKYFGLDSDYFSIVPSHTNTNAIIHRASEVWTLSSGVGFSALVFGKHVVSFRDTDFSCLGNRAGTIEEAISLPKITEDKRLRFLSWYLNKFTININDVNFEDKLEHRVERFSSGKQTPTLIF
jgi:hypothetical protein